MKKYAKLLPLTLLTLLFSACELDGQAAAPGEPGALAAGETGCTSSDPDRQCLALNVAAYKDEKGQPVLTEEQAVRMVQQINDFYKSCNIAFQIEKYEAIAPADFKLSYGAGSGNEVSEIRAALSTPNSFLVAVTGPWSTQAIAWTQMPGAAPFGTIVSRDYGDDPITVGHELGHYMGLDHSGTQGNLLYPTVYASNTTVTPSQCEAARAVNASDWPAMMRKGA